MSELKGKNANKFAKRMLDVEKKMIEQEFNLSDKITQVSEDSSIDVLLIKDVKEAVRLLKHYMVFSEDVLDITVIRKVDEIFGNKLI